MKIYTQLANRPKEFELFAEVNPTDQVRELGWLDEAVDDLLETTKICEKELVVERKAMEVDGEPAYVIVLPYESTDEMPEQTPVSYMDDNPRLYVKNRAYRLSRLAELDAPFQIVENEFWLLVTAIQALRRKEGDK